IKERLAALGFEPVASTPEDMAKQIKVEVEIWGKVIRAANIKAGGPGQVRRMRGFGRKREMLAGTCAGATLARRPMVAGDGDAIDPGHSRHYRTRGVRFGPRADLGQHQRFMSHGDSAASAAMVISPSPLRERKYSVLLSGRPNYAAPWRPRPSP